MQKIHAKKQLQLMALQCSICHNQYPTYRIAILKQTQKTQQKIKPNIIKQISRSPHKSPHNRMLSPLKNKIKSQEPSKSNGLRANTKAINTNTNGNNNICLQCLKTQDQNKLGAIKKQTYYDIGLKLIQKMPLPQYRYADECIKIAKNIQDKYEKIIKQTMKKLQEYKFVIYRICTQARKYCQNYIDNVKYFQKINVSQWQKLLRQNKNNKKVYSNISINQNQILNKIYDKFNLLKNLDSQLDYKVTISLPEVTEKFGKQIHSDKQKQKIVICDIPITSLINLQGRNFFGVADGRLIYQSLSGYSTKHQHQSLIRSLAYDSQYTLYSGSDDFTIKAWDLHQDQIRCFRTFGILKQVKSYHRNISLIRNGQALVSTRGQFDEFKLRVWLLSENNIKTNHKQFSNIGYMEGHQSFIRDMVAISNDLVLTVSDDRTVRLWDTKSYKQICINILVSRITGIAVNQQLQLCAISDDENKLSILDLHTLSLINGWIMPRKILYLKTTNNYRYLIIANINAITLWQWNGNKIHTIQIDVTFVPNLLMQVNQKLVVCDGTGVILKYHLPSNIVKDQ